METELLTPAQSRAARGLLDWSQADLGEAADLSLSHVRNFEKGRSVPSEAALAAMARALELAGIELIHENGGGAGARMAKRKGRSK